MSMLYIFKIHGGFDNIFFKKCWQNFRYHEIWQHPLGSIADSTNFDRHETIKMLSKINQNKKLCNIFHNITNGAAHKQRDIQAERHYKPKIFSFFYNTAC